MALALLVAPAAAVEKGKTGQNSFLWRAESKDAVVFILGSIHMAKADIYPLPANIEESFDRAGVLALEADPAKAQEGNLLGQLFTSAHYPGGETLRGHLSMGTYNLAGAEMERLGIPMETFEKKRPWFIAMTIESFEFLRLGFDPAYGIDVHFADEARGKKQIVELESFDYQIQLFSNFSEEENELFLLYTLKDLDSLKEGIDKLMKAWRTGDSKSFESLVSRTLNESPQLAPIYDKLFYLRNREMCDKIVKFLHGKETVFVVVGAAHLVGKKGIIELLKGKGYTVEQM